MFFIQLASAGGDLPALVTIQKLRCIVRNLQPKRKLNSCTVSILGVDKSQAVAVKSVRLVFLLY